MRKILVPALALVLSAGLMAQQLEPNTAGGSALVNGSGPSGVGTPIVAGVIDGSVNLQVDGAANAPYSMFFGQLAPASLPVGTQFVDFNLAAPFGVLVDGLNVNVAPGGLPNTLGFLDATGSASWTFPLTGATVGLTMCFQGAVLDPSTAIGLNITGCPEFTVVPIPPVNASHTGDDIVANYTLAAPISLYGFATQDISVSTNGWISLSGAATFGDFVESTANFLSGGAGGVPAGTAPFVAALWEDLDMGNGVTGQQVDTVELAPGLLQVTWVNADYYPNTPLGTFSCTIDSNNQTVFMDYTAYNCLTLPTEGIIGVSDGGVTLGAVAAETDLVVGGFVPGYGSSNPVESVFQNFDATGLFSEIIDITGLSMTFADIGGGSGTWSVF